MTLLKSKSIKNFSAKYSEAKTTEIKSGILYLQTFKTIIPAIKVSFDRSAQRSSALHAATNTRAQTAGHGKIQTRWGADRPRLPVCGFLSQ